MRIILQEYISILKEDGELDSLIAELLLSINILPLTKPQKGRQYGVDISAVGKDPIDGKEKVFLFVVKQGNLTRSAWNNGLNAVRPSVVDAIDTYIPTNLSQKHQLLPKVIVVATNGEIAQNINQTWIQFKEKHRKTDDLEFDFWGNDKLTHLVQQYMLSESLFPKEHRSLLRKTLAFLDLPEYDLHHFYQLIDHILSDQKKEKKVIKKTRLVSLCINILWKWCREENNLKPAVLSSERVILTTWDWMRKNDYMDNSLVAKEFYKLCQIQLFIGREYFVKLQNHYYVRDSLSKYSSNYTDYALNCWEQIGFLASFGLHEIFEADVRQVSSKGENQSIQTYLTNANTVADALVNLINTNPPCFYPQFDEHCIELTLALSLLCRTKKIEDAKSWIKLLIAGLNDSYKLEKFFPLFHSEIEKLLEIRAYKRECEVDSSILISILADWCVLLEDRKLYKLIRQLIEENYPKVNLQMWFPEPDTEDLLYTTNAMKDSGSIMHSIELHEDFDRYRQEIIDESHNYKPEVEFTFFKKGIYYIGLVASRHYRSYPLPIFWRMFLNGDKDKSRKNIQ